MTASISFHLMLPELILAGGALALLLLGVFRGDKGTPLVTGGAIIVLMAALFAVLSGPSQPVSLFSGAFTVDAYAKFMKVLVLAATALVLAMAGGYFERARLTAFEFPVLILLAATGMMMMVSASDLIALYLGLELMSLSLYVVASFHRNNAKSSEAGLKYFVLGALSSGMLLYGSSLIYGFTGQVSFEGISEALKGGVSLGLVFGLVFLLAGFAFKVSAVPFHMWTPDVYEGAPTPVTAFFAGAPKVAAMAVFTRAVVVGFPHAQHEWQQIVVFIAICSMVLGAFAAIGQTNIKRLMAYSSIANMGFALVGLAAGGESGVTGVLVYMAIYAIMTAGSFAFILALRRDTGPVETIDELAGLSRNHPWMAACFAALLFSLAGIPTLAGFFAKFYVFLAAIDEHLYVLSVIGVLSSVVGAYYYLRIVKIMYFDEPVAAFLPADGALKVVLVASSLFVTVFVLYPKPLLMAAGAAAKSLFQ